jgi:hypothetical protein
MKSTNLLIIGGAVVLGVFYLSNKNKKDKTDAENKVSEDAKPLPSNVKPEIVKSNFYTPAEANKKALEVVTKWIGLLDGIAKDVLTQENNNIIRQRIVEEQEKQNKIDYDKALALAKLKNETKFTFLGNTYWVANQQDVRNGSFITNNIWVKNPNNWFYNNQFSTGVGTSQISLLNSEIRFKFKQQEYATLGDFIKRAKQTQFADIYDTLKVIFTEIPKEDVNRLVILLPKYLFVSNDDFKYFQTYYENNPFTIEEQLYLKDVNVDELFRPKTRTKDINYTPMTVIGPYLQQGLIMTNNAVSTPFIQGR